MRHADGGGVDDQVRYGRGYAESGCVGQRYGGHAAGNAAQFLRQSVRSLERAVGDDQLARALPDERERRRPRRAARAQQQRALPPRLEPASLAQRLDESARVGVVADQPVAAT